MAVKDNGVVKVCKVIVGESSKEAPFGETGGADGTKSYEPIWPCYDQGETQSPTEQNNSLLTPPYLPLPNVFLIPLRGLHTLTLVSTDGLHDLSASLLISPTSLAN